MKLVQKSAKARKALFPSEDYIPKTEKADSYRKTYGK
jgi:hypothetical protein